MNTTFLKSIITSLLISVSPLIFSQHDHGSHNHAQMGMHNMISAPHGGMLKMAGKYHVEMVLDMLKIEDKITIYLLDKKGKPMQNKDVSGSVKITFKDGSSYEEKLVPEGDDHFVAQLKENKSFTSVVSMLVGEKWVKASYDHDMGSAEGAVFTCPMHPDITAKTAGKCPKCGMALVKK